VAFVKELKEVFNLSWMKRWEQNPDFECWLKYYQDVPSVIWQPMICAKCKFRKDPLIAMILPPVDDHDAIKNLRIPRYS